MSKGHELYFLENDRAGPRDWVGVHLTGRGPGRGGAGLVWSMRGHELKDESMGAERAGTGTAGLGGVRVGTQGEAFAVSPTHFTANWRCCSVI